MEYISKAAAKINIALDVCGKRPDGYHLVSMIMQAVSLYDEIKVITNRDNTIEIFSNTKDIPTDDSNIAYKAADLLKKEYNIKSGVKIYIEKKIPIAAGLAGGSTDCAATLRLLNKGWDLQLTKEEMQKAATKLGADVTFCLQGGTALAEGIGEVLTPLPCMPKCFIVLVKPDFAVSTAQVYKGYNIDQTAVKPDVKKVIEAIKTNNMKNIISAMGNVLETVTIAKHPVINEIKKKLINQGAIASMMSGSGPTVFGIFEDKNTAEYACTEWKKEASAFVVQPIEIDSI